MPPVLTEFISNRLFLSNAWFHSRNDTVYILTWELPFTGTVTPLEQFGEEKHF